MFSFHHSGWPLDLGLDSLAASNDSLSLLTHEVYSKLSKAECQLQQLPFFSAL